MGGIRGVAVLDSDAKKIGPGLKAFPSAGLSTVNGNKVTTESLTTWIENGDTLMPPMKERWSLRKSKMSSLTLRHFDLYFAGSSAGVSSSQFSVFGSQF